MRKSSTRQRGIAGLAGAAVARKLAAAAVLALIPLVALAALTLAPPAAQATPCTMPDNGNGTVDLPPLCQDGYEGPMEIVDGLPPGCGIDIAAQLTDIWNTVTTPGGNLGGEIHRFDATLNWVVTGTDCLEGFNRNLFIPVAVEVHSGPRTPGDPLQQFPQELVSLQGQLFGDPDFCELIVIAGGAFGMPSPGETTLTRLPSGDFNVDSFFDITYRIDWASCPGSILDGLSGSSMGTGHFHAGEPFSPPYDFSCMLPDNGSGTIDLPPACPDGYQGPMEIVDGLPPGCLIDIEAQLTDFYGVVTTPGGNLGGEIHRFDAYLNWIATGVGCLEGFNRTLSIPVSGEIHTGPRNPGDPQQQFPQELVTLQGELFGDPDFCVLVVTAGMDFGMPSPGETTLTRLPNGNFNVDSFFDITYNIEWWGCPGGYIDGLMGNSMGTGHFQAGEPFVPIYPYACVLPDNGGGTVDMPPDCPDGYRGSMPIFDGLPPGCWLEIDARLADFYGVVTTPGGVMGHEIHVFDAYLYWEVTGAGCMAGFQRSMAIPVTGEIHTGFYTPGDPVQSFPQELMRLDGVLYGDPDFCALEVSAGTLNGLPGPGHTILTQLPGGPFNVDSFFDVTYRIEWLGCPDSQLADLGGLQIGTEHFHAGEAYVVGVPDTPVVPGLTLNQNVPNPFNPRTEIDFVMAQPGHARLAIYDLQGRLVRTLVDGQRSAGRHTVLWQGETEGGVRAAAGVYLCVLRTAEGERVRKMAMIR